MHSADGRRNFFQDATRHTTSFCNNSSLRMRNFDPFSFGLSGVGCCRSWVAFSGSVQVWGWGEAHLSPFWNQKLCWSSVWRGKVCNEVEDGICRGSIRFNEPFELWTLIPLCSPKKRTLNSRLVYPFGRHTPKKHLNWNQIHILVRNKFSSFQNTDDSSYLDMIWCHFVVNRCYVYVWKILAEGRCCCCCWDREDSWYRIGVGTLKRVDGVFVLIHSIFHFSFCPSRKFRVEGPSIYRMAAVPQESF